MLVFFRSAGVIMSDVVKHRLDKRTWPSCQSSIGVMSTFIRKLAGTSLRSIYNANFMQTVVNYHFAKNKSRANWFGSFVEENRQTELPFLGSL